MSLILGVKGRGRGPGQELEALTAFLAGGLKSVSKPNTQLPNCWL